MGGTLVKTKTPGIAPSKPSVALQALPGQLKFRPVGRRRAQTAACERGAGEGNS